MLADRGWIQNPDIMTANELAAYLKVSTATVYKLFKRRGLPGFRIGVEYRFRGADVDKWIEAREKAREKP
jgi:excisionase family DNA binding protein